MSLPRLIPLGASTWARQRTHRTSARKCAAAGPSYSSKLRSSPPPEIKPFSYPRCCSAPCRSFRDAVEDGIRPDTQLYSASKECCYLARPIDGQASTTYAEICVARAGSPGVLLLILRSRAGVTQRPGLRVFGLVSSG
ncbi:unnamed protein product [Peniophora sp. CBMAI 1063]|nr:unnamed protein product [Peniophora sp. CBMAI 1063]